MKSLAVGIHDIDASPIYDWGSQSVTSTRIVVGKVALPEPAKDYYVDFSYTVPDDINRGAIAMEKFDATEQAYTAFDSALAALGFSEEAIADRNVLYCKSAAYHEDGAFNTIFATALWHGESGDVVFPRLGVKVTMTPGTFIMFDCHEPHCFLKEGETQWDEAAYANARFSHFLSYDLDRLAPEVQDFFGLQVAARPPRGAYSSKGMTVCQKTGAFVAASASHCSNPSGL